MNARAELIQHVGDRTIKCAAITDDTGAFILPINCPREQAIKFFELLDFEYDDGLGFQELYGVIWYTDGTWSVRREYDGSERWEYVTCPEIPACLMEDY